MATITAPTSAQPLVSVEEYLHTSYRPDCDYIDGHLEDRNVGEKEHSILQRYLTVLFSINRDAWQVEVYPELRTQVSPSRFRVPDILVLNAGVRFESILKDPPLVAIEILSPEDRQTRMQDRVEDYLNFGIEHIWIIDPKRRTAQAATKTGLHFVQTGELIVPEMPIRIVLSELFAELDRA